MPVPSSAKSVCIAAFVIVAVFSRLSAAQSPEAPDPTGGLRSRGMAPGLKGSGSSREELVRQWDLDGNGTIDASEASVARARMRRSRMQLELDSGIDPVTGKPRVIVDGESPDDKPPAESEQPMDLPPERRKRTAEDPALPGTRVPDAKLPDSTPITTPPSAPTAPSVPTTDSRPSSGSEKRSTPARPAPSASRPGSITGGIRAGAPAARPGYGALGPKRDLNAGIPLPDTSRSAGARGEAPRGGLLPSMRPPTAPRPGVPATPAPRPPRVSADDIGGF